MNSPSAREALTTSGMATLNSDAKKRRERESANSVANMVPHQGDVNKLHILAYLSDDAALNTSTKSWNSAINLPQRMPQTGGHGNRLSVESVKPLRSSISLTQYRAMPEQVIEKRQANKHKGGCWQWILSLFTMTSHSQSQTHPMNNHESQIFRHDNCSINNRDRISNYRRASIAAASVKDRRDSNQMGSNQQRRVSFSDVPAPSFTEQRKTAICSSSSTNQASSSSLTPNTRVSVIHEHKMAIASHAGNALNDMLESPPVHPVVGNDVASLKVPTSPTEIHKQVSAAFGRDPKLDILVDEADVE